MPAATGALSADADQCPSQWLRLEGASAAPLAAAEQALQGRGRVVLRPSGTEPVVRVMVEADDKILADQWAQTIAEAIRQVA